MEGVELIVKALRKQFEGHYLILNIDVHILEILLGWDVSKSANYFYIFNSVSHPREVNNKMTFRNTKTVIVVSLFIAFLRSFFSLTCIRVLSFFWFFFLFSFLGNYIFSSLFFPCFFLFHSFLVSFFLSSFSSYISFFAYFILPFMTSLFHSYVPCIILSPFPSFFHISFMQDYIHDKTLIYNGGHNAKRHEKIDLESNFKLP